MNPTTFPTQVAVSDLDTKHPELAKYSQLYEDLRLLYVGGKELKDNCFRFLQKRQRELGTAFLAKQAKINYDPVLSTVVSWYVSKLFENDLEIEFASTEPVGVDSFYSDFLEECDRGGHSLELFAERMSEEILVYGRSYFLIDVPKLEVPPSNLLEQKTLGGLNPYLVHVNTTAVTNWQRDAWGNYEWAVVHNSQAVQSFLGKPVTVETWTCYTTTEYAVYKAEYGAGQARPGVAQLVDAGSHAMAAQNVCPLICVKTDQKFWIGNRTYLSLIEHFNAYNSLGFSLWQALNPVPVIQDGQEKGVELNQTVSEFAFLHLPYNGKAFWLEPEGTSWDASLKYMEQLRENIYRMSHCSPVGRSTRATPASQSGFSKELEMSVAADILNTFGSVIRTVLQQTLNAVAAIRGESVRSDVRGFNFSEDTAAGTVDLAIATKGMGLHSKTALRELEKKAVRALFRDANADLLQKMVEEIEAAPDTEFQPKPAATPGVPGQSAPGEAAQVALNISERTTT